VALLCRAVPYQDLRAALAWVAAERAKARLQTGKRALCFT